ncbi:hypothetical protein BDC45DRAFT_575176 [Circinella umbellata]|nr:hypothetical protein BDC45DRAFT_575172 [Circinella umbellata]KAI7848098.1 hypothetical protein BDC45DRAFT_575176 [Circinella umbellata]
MRTGKFAVPTAPFSNSKPFSTIQKQASTTCDETRLVQGPADEENYLEPELSSKDIQKRKKNSHGVECGDNNNNAKEQEGKAEDPGEQQSDIEDKEYNNKEALNKLWKTITSFEFFDQETQFDEAWVQATTLEFLNKYRYDRLKDIQINGSEMDYVTHCGLIFDRCFENIGEKSIDQQQKSVRPDFLLIKGGVEFAVGECGKEDLGGVGKKEIVERGLQVPKIVKI